MFKSHLSVVLVTALSKSGYSLEDIPKVVDENIRLVNCVSDQQSQLVTMEHALNELLAEKQTQDGGGEHDPETFVLSAATVPEEHRTNASFDVNDSTSSPVGSTNAPVDNAHAHNASPHSDHNVLVSDFNNPAGKHNVGDTSFAMSSSPRGDSTQLQREEVNENLNVSDYLFFVFTSNILFQINKAQNLDTLLIKYIFNF